MWYYYIEHDYKVLFIMIKQISDYSKGVRTKKLCQWRRQNKDF
jgi:hypothetical protein